MDKKQLTETDIRTKFITPALVGTSSARWNVMTQLREEVFFAKGRVIVRGKTVRRGEGKKADYILYFKPRVPIVAMHLGRPLSYRNPTRKPARYAVVLCSETGPWR